MPWLRALVVALKKIQTVYNFQDLISNFQTFFMPGKLLCKFQDFFKNSRLCMNPVVTVILGGRDKPVLFCQCLQVVFNFFNF